MSAINDESLPPGGMRELQELEIAFAYRLSEVEHALAAEACALSRIFDEAGIDFDPLTFVALRIVSECLATQIDPADVVAELHGRGVLERAVSLAQELQLGGSL